MLCSGCERAGCKSCGTSNRRVLIVIVTLQNIDKCKQRTQVLAEHYVRIYGHTGTHLVSTRQATEGKCIVSPRGSRVTVTCIHVGRLATPRATRIIYMQDCPHVFSPLTAPLCLPYFSESDTLLIRSHSPLSRAPFDAAQPALRTTK